MACMVVVLRTQDTSPQFPPVAGHMVEQLPLSSFGRDLPAHDLNTVANVSRRAARLNTLGGPASDKRSILAKKALLVIQGSFEHRSELLRARNLRCFHQIGTTTGPLWCGRPPCVEPRKSLKITQFCRKQGAFQLRKPLLLCSAVFF
jgi:hypothetical protein